MIEKIREYFISHVTLANEFDNILADFLGEKATTYTIEPVPSEPILKSYTDGGYLGQYQFYFGSREFYDDSVVQNISNLDFYERLKNEIEYNNKNHILPAIDGIQSIECQSHGSIQNEEQNGTAKYIIQMRITYLKSDAFNNNVSE